MPAESHPTILLLLAFSAVHTIEQTGPEARCRLPIAALLKSMVAGMRLGVHQCGMSLITPPAIHSGLIKSVSSIIISITISRTILTAK
jgi:hypothetical protein